MLSLASLYRCLLCLPLLLAGCAGPGSRVESGRPAFLYSRYFNAEGETRYLPDGNYKELLQRLSSEFDVRVHNRPLNAETLAGVDVVLIANPSDQAVGNNPPPHHVDDRDIAELTRYVRDGGALVVMANQENHNLEVDDMNRLLRQFGLAMTNVFTDAKLIPIPKNTPVVGGLRWAFYTGNEILVQPNHAARPRALVKNDRAIRLAAGTREDADVLMAVSEPGKGKVIVVTDSGWVADWALNNEGVGGVALQPQDNFEIFRRLARWAADDP